MCGDKFCAATKKQREYIELLSGYDCTKEQDEADIKDYLERVGKATIFHLSKKEANELIQILLQRPTEYTFACGKKETLHKQDVNRYNVFGDFEGCLHACPDGIDVSDCPYWEGCMKKHTPSGARACMHHYNLSFLSFSFGEPPAIESKCHVPVHVKN